jgi:type VI secretion system protein ImpK
MAKDDDPFAPVDGTVIRPRPGGGARRGGPAPQRIEPTLGLGTTPSQPVRVARETPIENFIRAGGNPVLEAAAPLLAIASRLQSTVTNADAHSLREQAMREVRQFDDRIKAAGVSAEDAVVARYVLCTFFDSAVLNTPWGAQSDWSGNSLLLIFHKERGGGEKFFQILERIRSQPSRYIDLIELQYVCLALGYEGKYRIEDRGRERLADLQHELHRIIRDARQLRDQELSAHWRGVEDKRNPIFTYLPWWIVASLGVAAITVAFFIYSSKLTSAAEPIKAALTKPPVQINYTEAPAPAHVNRLKELLAPQEQRGVLSVEDFGDKTVVTLTATDLFRSGSAKVNDSQTATLQAVAHALNQVPGKVVIVGHTDDQPVRSLQFADNFELSRERAVAVARVLQPNVDNFGRIEWVGVGASQPRYQPPSTAENRARNRRVEIVHVSEGAAR